MNKSNKLKQVLRQMIREEVTDQVNKAMGKILVEVLKEARNIPVSQPTPVEEETAFLKPTGNAALDSVLAETARTHTHLPSGNEGVSLAQLMGDGFDKIGKNEKAITTDTKPATKMDYLRQIVSENAPATTQESVIDSPAVPDMLKKVFKKDFRSVMKAMERQKKEGNSGLYAGKVQMSG